MLCTLDDIRERALPIIKRDAKDLKRVIVFGSYSRGDQTPESDLDLFVDGRFEYKKGEMIDTEQKIADALSVSVDLLTRTALNNSVVRDQLQKSIERDGVVLYG